MPHPQGQAVSDHAPAPMRRGRHSATQPRPVRMTHQRADGYEVGESPSPPTASLAPCQGQRPGVMIQILALAADSL